jgi:molecular chaperone DnaK (HSP70)
MGSGVEVLLAPLCIETVSGYCDVVIPRNTPIPCEKTETFVTSGVSQTSAKIRIAQGNSPRFAENALLGEMQIGNLGPAPRGETEITLSMSLGRDGVLTLKARDDKGQEVMHQVTLPRTASA